VVLLASHDIGFGGSRKRPFLADCRPLSQASHASAHSLR
jgi:hypothetical protein